MSIEFARYMVTPFIVNNTVATSGRSNICPAVVSEFGSPAAVPRTAFFNVAESLDALEKWRDEMEYDAEDTAILSVASLQQNCSSPQEG